MLFGSFWLDAEVQNGFERLQHIEPVGALQNLGTIASSIVDWDPTKPPYCLCILLNITSCLMSLPLF